jgi:hypothetical protein
MSDVGGDVTQAILYVSACVSSDVPLTVLDVSTYVSARERPRTNNSGLRSARVSIYDPK